MEMLVKTLAGLENILAQELEAIGAQNIEILKRAVKCTGDQACLYNANLWLRTGIRVLVPVAKFNILNEEDLYEQMKLIDWSQYLQLHQTFAIDAVSQSERYTHSRFIALKTKDAIADWFREKNNNRPSVNPKSPNIRFHVHISHNNEVSLLLDSSGDGLHRRGYRTDGGIAPLNEVLAAGMVLLSGWKADQPFIDIMCGSGTLLIEAGLIAARQAPGMHRSFAFEKWQDFDANLWSEVKQSARALRRPHEHPIIGIDKNFRAIRVAENNIDAARLQSYIRIRRSDFHKYLPPAGPGTLITNPPYGLRVESEDITGLYKALGDKFKTDFQGYQAWVLSANLGALKQVGLRPSRKIALMNGPLECRFHRYELYAGTKKVHKRQ